ncbi:MAG TPA: monovalent cation/H(+) antiporter subunit G [Chthoniobacteraceae bacterium]|jgi:monovalent cation/proton antiporter MnhG/PhaG subunit|nr:monovalent cation/H(+) antiporter subunit G [Chthoniobacteraceae bacterium]
MIREAVVTTLLVCGVLVEILCCVGLVAMRNPLDRLHAIAPANILAPIFFAAAVMVREGAGQASVKCALIAFVLILVSPVISHATGRAVWIREKNHREHHS